MTKSRLKDFRFFSFLQSRQMISPLLTASNDVTRDDDDVTRTSASISPEKSSWDT